MVSRSPAIPVYWGARSSFVLIDGLRVSGVTRRIVEVVATSPPRSLEPKGGFSPPHSSSSCPCISTWRAHRACDPAPSTHCRISKLVSRRRLVVVPQGKLLALLLLARLAHRLSEIPFTKSSSHQNVGIFGMAESMTGSDGRRRGSMYRESKNSPRTSGGRTGSQEAASCSRSKRRSML